MSPRIVRTWLVACRDCSARLLTSCATTPKPLPCSPALAASMAALTASRFDCAALLGEPHHAGGDRLHLLANAVHAGASLLGGLAAALRTLRRLLRAVGDVFGLLACDLRRLPDFFDRSGRLRYGRGRLAGAGSKLGGGGDDFIGR